MRPNGLMYVVVFVTVVFCFNAALSLFPEAPAKKVSSEKPEVEIDVELPVLDPSIAEQTLKLLARETKASKQQRSERKAAAPKVVQKDDELKVDGKFLRLVGVFDSSANRFAVVEQRDSTSGKILDKVELTANGQLGKYSVKAVTINNVTLSNGEETLIFEMYKKPKLIKG